MFEEKSVPTLSVDYFSVFFLFPNIILKFKLKFINNYLTLDIILSSNENLIILSIKKSKRVLVSQAHGQSWEYQNKIFTGIQCILCGQWSCVFYCWI